MLEADPQLAAHPLAGEIEEGDDVRGHGAAAVHDEVGVLGRDLGTADPLAAQADLLDQLARRDALRTLPHEARRGESQRLGRALVPEPLLQLAMNLGDRPALQAQAAPDEHGPRRRLERVVAERPGAGFELPERAIGMEKVDGAHEVADAAVLAAGVHGQGAADVGGDPDEALDSPEVEGRRLPDEPGQAGPGAGHGLLALKLRAAQAAIELEGHSAHASIAHQEVVASPDHGHAKLVALGKLEGMADIVDVLGYDEDIRRPADAERRMKAKGLLEPNFAPDLS